MHTESIDAGEIRVTVVVHNFHAHLCCRLMMRGRNLKRHFPLRSVKFFPTNDFSAKSSLDKHEQTNQMSINIKLKTYSQSEVNAASVCLVNTWNVLGADDLSALSL